MQINVAEHPILQEAVTLLHKLEEAGHVAYFVGGAVRDVLLGRAIHDVDIATSATPKQTMSIFPKTFATGLQHGTVTVVHNGVNYEVTTFRVELSYVDFRRPEQVSFVKELKLDLSRRDFTMNAMAINASGEVVDYFDGLKALEHKKLIAVGDAHLRFQEDALRMLRAIRFATTYNLVCDEQLWQAITEKKQLLRNISMERIQQELEKILLHRISIRNFRLLYESELLTFTKRPIKLQSVLQYWFTGHSTLLEVEFKRGEWLWAVLYSYSGKNVDEAREDFSALVFSKKQSVAIRLHMEWIQFFKDATNALSHHDARSIFLEQYSFIFERYTDLLSLLPAPSVSLEKVKQCITLYWMEQLQQHRQAYMEQLHSFIDACGFIQMLELLPAIEEQRQIKSVAQLNITGRQLVEELKLDAGAWISTLLQQLYMGVNLKLIINDFASLMHASKMLMTKR